MAKAVSKKKTTTKKAPSRRGTERIFTNEEREAIKNCARMGMPQTRIAEIFGCSFNTLKKHCGAEIEFGSELATAEVCGSLFDNATAQMNVTAQIFWMKTRGGWREGDENAEKPPGVLNINVHPTVTQQ